MRYSGLSTKLQAEHTTGRRFAWTDAMIVTAVVLCSFAPYTSRIGFYSDDWSFVELSRFADEASVLGTVQELRQYNRMRPIGDLTRAVQLRVFDDEPRGYHLVNGAAFLLVVFLFFAVLHQIGVRRDLALAAALIYAVMPHYSTLRFWFSSNVANVSCALFLVSVLVDLHAIERRGIARVLLRSLSLLCIAVSLLTYELVLPLCAGAALCIGWLRRPARRSQPWRDVLWVNLALVVAIFLYKASIPDRLGQPDRMTLVQWVWRTLFDPAYGPGSSGLNIGEVFQMYAVTYGAMLPLNAVRLALRHPDASVVVAATLCGLLTWASVRAATKSQADVHHGSGFCLALGAVTFVLGYAIFLTNGNIQLTPTGTGNRTAGVAALGAALILAGGVALMAGRMGRYRGDVLAVAVGTLVLLFSLVTGTLSTFWREAYREQIAILSQLREDVPTIPPAATLLLDGVCMYQGPAPVFEAPWDLQSVLRIRYDDASLRADIVNRTLRVEPDGIHTAEYDTPTHYRFENVAVYDVQSRRLTALGNFDQASAYFGPSHPRGLSNGCPQGYGGWGVPVFD